ncbi:MAG TPA: ankyrin repeat domain-containing protein [Acidimicrobiales bacterium]
MSDSEIFDAILAGDVERVRAHLAENPSAASARNDDGLSAVLAAQYRRDDDAVEAILSAGPDLDVFDAAAVGDCGRLTTLLDAEPSLVNAFASDGFFPLGLAAYFGRSEAVRLLLERGADVSATARNPMRVQALHAAVAGRSREAVRMLLAAGADPNAEQHGGWTPLMASQQHGDDDISADLIAAGARPTSTP